MKGYYFITDSKLSKAGNARDVQNAAESGVSVIQYRNKRGTTKQLYQEAKKLKELCKQANKETLFLINDRVDIVLAIDADGVHLGQDDMPYETARRLLGNNKTIGITVHNLEEAKQAEEMGANYLGISPIFATGTKSDAGKPCGTSLITQVKNLCNLPVIAIGGITHENAQEVVDAGADGLCAISAVIAKDDVKKEIMEFQRLFE